MTKQFLCIALLAIGAGATMPAAAASPNPFAKAQQTVDIGGRRLNLYCSGSGPTTVVFDAQSGSAGWIWAAVQPEVAKHTRACVYDRAGLGFSDPSPRPATADNAVDDLHKLLGAANIAAPYILVGNSSGGANVQLFAYRYPEQVKGLVLIEAGHEDETARLNRVTEGKMGQIHAFIAEREKACAAQAEQGFAPGSKLLAECIEPSSVPFFGRELSAVRFASMLTPKYWRTIVSESNNYEAGVEALRAVRRPFGALPLIVLSRSISPFAVPGQPQSALNKALENENLAIHRDMTALSSVGIHRIVPGAAHVIQFDQPAAVTKAITDVLAQIKP
jgi:pimeloyl-ACP methyl ester carboxylesterase